MTMASCSAEIPVLRDECLHLRPMQLLVERALKFNSTLTLSRGGKAVDAKSMFDVMLLAARKGPVAVQAEGADAEAAVKALADLLHRELNKE